jgi:hypothetical protein
MWNALTDKGIKEGIIKAPSGNEQKVEIVRFFDSAQRDKMKDMYMSEPSIIDARLGIGQML